MLQTIYTTRSDKFLVVLKTRKDGTKEVQYVVETSVGYEKVGGIYGWDEDFFKEVVVGEFFDKVF